MCFSDEEILPDIKQEILDTNNPNVKLEDQNIDIPEYCKVRLLKKKYKKARNKKNYYQDLKARDPEKYEEYKRKRRDYYHEKKKVLFDERKYKAKKTKFLRPRK